MGSQQPGPPASTAPPASAARVQQHGQDTRTASRGQAQDWEGGQGVHSDQWMLDKDEETGRQSRSQPVPCEGMCKSRLGRGSLRTSALRTSKLAQGYSL